MSLILFGGGVYLEISVSVAGVSVENSLLLESDVLVLLVPDSIGDDDSSRSRSPSGCGVLGKATGSSSAL